MKAKRTLIAIAVFFVVSAWGTAWQSANSLPAGVSAAGPDQADNRRVTFTPAEPAPGRSLLFTASNFRTPNLLQWDMGDGTTLISGGKAAPGQDATLAYAYAAAGQYLVRVYDDGGSRELPPVTALVTITDRPRSLQIDPEKPLAGQAAVITALNFRTPEKIGWDLGDGTAIRPGNGPGVLFPSFQVSHVYEKAGDYLVKAYDNNGDTKQPPLTLAVRIATVPAIAAPQAAPKEVLVVKKPAAVIQARLEPEPAVETSIPRRKKYPLVKIGPYVGYYRPRDMLLKQIYGEGDVIYGGRLGIHLWKGFYLWLSGSRYQIISKTTFTGDKTTLTLLPVSGFLRYGLRLGFFNPYAGIGYTYLSFKEESELGNVSGKGNNMTYEGGFEIRMNRSFIVDFSVRFDQIKVNPTGFEIDLGGLHAGVALLVSF